MRQTVRTERAEKQQAVRTPVRSATGRIEVTGHDGEILTRKRPSHEDKYYIPREIIPEGWDYQWNRKSVYNQIDTSELILMSENGWRPVPAERHPGMFMPVGAKGEIERDGLVLMERPMALTLEARAEEKLKADGLIRAQSELLGQRLPDSFNNQHPGVRPVINRTYEPGFARDPLPIEAD